MRCTSRAQADWATFDEEPGCVEPREVVDDDLGRDFARREASRVILGLLAHDGARRRALDGDCQLTDVFLGE